MSDISAPLPENRAPVVAAISMVEPIEPSLPGWHRWALVVLGLVCTGALWTAWNAQQRVRSIEQELVRRQQDSQGQAAEARVLAKQAQELSREAGARTTLLETRLTEVALQRTQVEDLIKSLSQSRDENLVVDIDSTLRVAIQQSALTGSADPLMNALQSADDRIARAKQPRLNPIRRAVAKDLDRLRSTRVADLGALTIRLDEAIRLVDEAPLLNQAPGTPRSATPLSGTPNGTGAQPPAQTEAKVEPTPSDWKQQSWAWVHRTFTSAWAETKALVRVTRISRPEGMLISPDQSFFLRENIKLRLLNARLALLSRQTASAVADIETAQNALSRYFDTDSRKTQLLQSTLKDISSQSPQTLIPRPDDTLAALAAVSGSSR
ncbi:uroporphyrinogen-III C-methyltransferase [Aquabacterium sp.]|uniref:uroporphyrinogen-III C-methyltransferase n=1 Tax=Aquabacterium sp. TaxID=1872578 RepID=UPI002E35FC87|nr:uroporphyrinogen-III C-methyltransferase [Aquabacterium sp.]HEX5310319.1 uroporphyrinogen-III C-methyltransferase [Aquabacterium sp.]